MDVSLNSEHSTCYIHRWNAFKSPSKVNARNRTMASIQFISIYWRQQWNVLCVTVCKTIENCIKCINCVTFSGKVLKYWKKNRDIWACKCLGLIQLGNKTNELHSSGNCILRPTFFLCAQNHAKIALFCIQFLKQ